ncbi:tRNA (guanine(37)-N(1))-methyltransferase [hydrothermal vent metagenome]|uniref:tRNA (guanine-N(1)-)-methyltransferase n=1 Tax=hydrothermal vent metagenome TaxID=652676 RepID=A0A3B1DXG6_9ZZZZ
MRFDVISLFPEIFESYLQQSLLSLAIKKKLVDVHLWNLRDWATDQRKSVDDKPFGGGPGMLLCCQPVFDAVEEVQSQGEAPGQLVMLTPQGKTFKQPLVEKLATFSRIVLLCGRYEGFDERIRIGLNPLEISVGDFIANGGEVPAMLIIDTVARIIPGVLGDEASHQFESFTGKGLLEYPQYTRPREYRTMEVPEVLLNGDHQKIKKWREEQSYKRTKERREDLLNKTEDD